MSGAEHSERTVTKLAGGPIALLVHPKSNAAFTGLRLDGRGASQYGGPMKRFVTSALLLAFAAPLSACGISGPLKTPPPVWGEAKPLSAASEAEVTESEATETGAEAEANDVEDDEDIGYGANVADTP